MCGIFGSLNFSGPAEAAPLGLLAHRGPDEQAEWRSADGRVCLGHTRLAILDLSPTGSQPMVDPATGNVIVFNGEIYNHQQVRAELAGHGIVWKGTSDTETLLKGYAVLGEGVLDRLKGMFSFLIHDAARGRIFAARDRFGIKPLYFVCHGDGVMMASEVRALLAFLNLAPTQASLSSYLSVGACPEEELLFPSIEVLSAAHTLVVERGGRVHRRRYWRPAPARASTVGATVDPVRRVRELLDLSVRQHLQADVPVATFLSGGVDSSIITAIAAKNHSQRLRTFSVGFAQEDFDESVNAAEVARRFNTEHTRIELRESDVIAQVGEAVEKMDLPSVDAINTYVISKAVAGAGIKVALSGLGGDELFGGYPSFNEVPKLKIVARLPVVWRRYFGWMLGKLGRRLAVMPDTTDIATLAMWRRVFWTSDMLAEAGLPLREFPVEPLSGAADDFTRISWTELTHYMRHMLLRDSDQMSMASSLELRVPFLDHELVEYVLGLPAEVKQRYPRIKGLLVESCLDLLPPAVYNRPKMGFALPMDTWMRGPLANYVREGIGHLEDRQLLNPAVLRRTEERFVCHQAHWTRYWSLVVLGHYLRKNQRRPDIGR